MKNKKVTIEDLAAMVQTGFAEAENSHSKRFNRTEERLDTLERGQEEIKLKLDNVAYRFELVELQRRVEILEKKVSNKRS
ncbi:MAG: hypothetical protein PHS62_00145 [Patescibacteria group bacterium]|nr:hypothetical protein [Patescibacteria group bacterium]